MSLRGERWEKRKTGSKPGRKMQRKTNWRSRKIGKLEIEYKGRLREGNEIGSGKGKKGEMIKDKGRMSESGMLGRDTRKKMGQ